MVLGGNHRYRGHRPKWTLSEERDSDDSTDEEWSVKERGTARRTKRAYGNIDRSERGSGRGIRNGSSISVSDKRFYRLLKNLREFAKRVDSLSEDCPSDLQSADSERNEVLTRKHWNHSGQASISESGTSLPSTKNSSNGSETNSRCDEIEGVEMASIEATYAEWLDRIAAEWDKVVASIHSWEATSNSLKKYWLRDFSREWNELQSEWKEKWSALDSHIRQKVSELPSGEREPESSFLGSLDARRDDLQARIQEDLSDMKSMRQAKTYTKQ